MTKIITIECGTLDQALEEKFGDYPSMFENLLAGHGLETATCRLVRGEALPKIADADGFLISGSRHGVYDDLPWIEPLKDFIRACVDARKPLIGICFGHQIMAEAMGGKVIKSPKGWGLGAQTYEVRSEMFDFPESMSIQAIHQDQVVEKPAGAEVFASSDFCEYAGLVYGGDKPFAASLQPHPEFGADFVEELVRARRGKVYPESVADQALASMNAPLDRNEWGAWIANFFKTAS